MKFSFDKAHRNRYHCDNRLKKNNRLKKYNRLEKNGVTSGNNEVDKFNKETSDKSNHNYYYYYHYNNPLFLKWVPFNKFKNIKKIGEGGFAKVYSATWIDDKIKYAKQGDGNWKRIGTEPIKVALKRLNGSQNMPSEYLNEVLQFTFI
jgi:hypothetical protein